MAKKVIFLTTTGVQSWTVPSDWNSAFNTIECVGGGGGMSMGTPNTQLDGAGAGGAYSMQQNVTFTPGASVAYAVGIGGTGATSEGTNGNPGGDTWIATNSSATVITSSGVVCGAKGGGAGIRGGTSAAGGAAGSGVGTYLSSGGASGGATTGGNGGGGAAGPAGAGGAGGHGINISTDGGGGGGGGNGGTAGSNGGTSGGAGGNDYLGNGSGAGGGSSTNGTAGTGSGGGGGGGPSSGGGSTAGGAGGASAIWTQTVGGSATSGPGGGGGGSGGGEGSGNPNSTNCASGGLYGGGGGCAWSGSAGGGNGAQGIIVITYDPLISLNLTVATGTSSSSGTWFGDYAIYEKIVNGTTPGVLAQLTMDIAATASGIWQVGLYADSAGTPGSLVAESEVVLLPASTGNTTLNIFGGPTIAASSTYWAAMNNSATSTQAFTKNSSGPSVKQQAVGSMSLPSTATPASSSGNLWMQLTLSAITGGVGAKTDFFFGA